MKHELSYDSFDFQIVVVGAARYYLGRHTIAVSGFCDWLNTAIPNIPTNILETLYKDISGYLEEFPTNVAYGVDDSKPWHATLTILETILYQRNELL